MTATTFLFALLFLWLLTGIVCSFVMGRRGYDPFSWGVLGALFGPLIVPLAIATTRRNRRSPTTVAVRHEGVAGPGPIGVLVGIDGSADAEAAACTVTELFGARLGQLTLATVIDYDAADSTRHGGEAFVALAEQHLRDAAAALPDVDPRTVVLTGEPARAILAYAQDNPVDLVAVGTHGSGLTKAMLGSVAAKLVRQHDIPVLVAGAANVWTGSHPTA